MLAIGLTGGIASGKSTVAALFAELGVPVLDADAIGRELVAPGTAGLARIVQAFGGEVLDAHGALDRGRMRARVFADPASRQRLEAILHPLIRAEMQARLQRVQAAYCILVIPLLVETGQTDLVQRVLVVDVPDDLQQARAAARDGLNPEQLAQVLAAQTTRERRLAAADDVIVNDGTVEDLRARVAHLHRHYLERARNID